MGMTRVQKPRKASKCICKPVGSGKKKSCDRCYHRHKRHEVPPAGHDPILSTELKQRQGIKLGMALASLERDDLVNETDGLDEEIY